jgi:hypothetical protein
MNVPIALKEYLKICTIKKINRLWNLKNTNT